MNKKCNLARVAADGSHLFQGSPILCGRLISKLVLMILSGLLLPHPTSFAQLPAGTWQYHWGDEFHGPALDTTKWSHNYPWGATHNHLAVMNASNVLFGDGTLTLRAQRNGSGNNFTSGAISSGYNRFTFSGGFVEARIQLPSTAGSWPAFWGLFTGWPPEADIMEFPIDTAAGNGYQRNQYHTAFHYSTGSGNAAGGGQVNPGIGNLDGAYHTFGMHWITDQSVAFYFNGQMVRQFNNPTAVAQMEQMYLILNYAVGGWPGTPNLSEWGANHSDEMKVDWVRVWKSASARSSTWSYQGADSYVLWDASTNWSNGSPNLGGVTASFGTRANAPIQNIDWSGRRTLTTMNLDGDTRYRFGWPDDRLVMAMGNNGTTAPSINIASTSTQSHEIQGQLEFVGGLSINNNSNQAFRLTGKLMGQGGLNINGPGAVVFEANAGIYGGNTVIDSGAAGPAIARVRSQDPFGNGQVIIGAGGNSTTARLELENNSLVTNLISLNGRNNNSIGIQNNSGNNVISGTIQAGVGGSQYRISSAAGQLTLSGAAAGGVAMTSNATGIRTFTLQGNGNGIVSGAITDGLGLVGVIKEGNGKWALNGQNTYSRATTVNVGQLIVNGTISNSASYTVAAGAALGGSGRLGVGNVNILAKGFLTPGDDLGTLSIDQSLNMAGVYEWQIKSPTSADVVTVGGNLSITGQLSINLLPDLDIEQFDKFTLFAYQGTFSGAFTNQLDGWMINYTDKISGLNTITQAGPWKYVTLTAMEGRRERLSGGVSGYTAVPEPSSSLLISILPFALLARRRRSQF